MSERERAVAPIRCPSCGSERDQGAPPGGQGAEPITHCEWCGVEYPLPDPQQSAPPPSGA